MLMRCRAECSIGEGEMVWHKSADVQKSRKSWKGIGYHRMNLHDMNIFACVQVQHRGEIAENYVGR